MQKTFKADVTDEGTVTAVIATLGVKDHDGDVAFKENFPADGHQLIMSAYNHKSWQGELPYGFGTLKVSDTEAIVNGQFFMDTTQGANAHKTVKAMSEAGLQEWSYSLRDIESHRGEFKGDRVRFLDSFSMHEFSPTIKGAGLGTRTLEIKGDKQLSSMISRLLDDAGNARWGDSGSYVYLDDFDVDAETAVFCVRDWAAGTRESYQVDFTRTDTSVVLGDTETPVESTTAYLPKSLKFSEHSDRVMVQVKGLIDRASEVMTLRAEKGKSISEESRTQIVKLREQIDVLLATPTPSADIDEEMHKLFLKSMQQLTKE